MSYQSMSRADLAAALDAVKSRMDSTNDEETVENLAKIYSEILAVIVNRNAIEAAARHRALRTMYRRSAGIIDPVPMRRSHARQLERFRSRMRNLTSKATNSKRRRTRKNK